MSNWITELFISLDVIGILKKDLVFGKVLIIADTFVYEEWI